MGRINPLMMGAPAAATGFTPGGNGLDPSNKSTQLTLTNSNYTATFSGSAAWVGARGVSSHSSGKWYFEAQANTAAVGSNQLEVGFCNSSYATATEFLGQNTNSFGFDATGGVHGVLSHPTYAAWSSIGDRVDVAIDIGGGNIWFRVNGGDWNGSSSNNPATGVGGLPISGNLTGGTYYAAIAAHASADQITVNFGGTFGGTVPSGFSAWN